MLYEIARLYECARYGDPDTKLKLTKIIKGFYNVNVFGARQILDRLGIVWNI